MDEGNSEEAANGTPLVSCVSLLLIGIVAMTAVSLINVAVSDGPVIIRPPKPEAEDTHHKSPETKDDSLRNYITKRVQVQDRESPLGSKIVLNEWEKKLNYILLSEKKSILTKSENEWLSYYPALSYHRSKDWMVETKIFKIIKKMPKGAALHIHEPAIADLEKMVNDLTYKDNVFLCKDKQGYYQLGAFQLPPENPDCPWENITTLRNQADDKGAFDWKIRTSLDFLSSDPLQFRNADPLVQFNGTNAAWDRFNKYFAQVGELLNNIDFMREYYVQALQEYYDDNVQYIELRGAMIGYKTLSGAIINGSEGVQMFKDATDAFVAEHPDFLGAKVIMSGLRFKPREPIAVEIKQAMALRRQFPNFFVGYDLVAQEDPLQPLIYYLDSLLYPTQVSLDDAMPYFFHAGETKWHGTEVDNNLVDAILLNTSRLGHAFALAKHPELLEIVKSRGIAVEVNPISNQLLGLVEDIRNHAIAPLLTDDFPLVISSDDPAVWGVLPLTHDFFIAFMNLAGQQMGVGFLKQIAINSIKYSAMNETEKQAAMKLWETKWDNFVKEAVEEFS